MVRATLNGSKTQHRVPIKSLVGQPACNVRYHEGQWQQYGAGGVWLTLKCPFGGPGDYLWMREAFCLEVEVDGNVPPHNDSRPIRYDSTPDDCQWWEQPHYRASDPPPELLIVDKNGEQQPGCKWKPSIHMPRWASRIRRLVKRRWVERLQDISEEDAVAEGVVDVGNTGVTWWDGTMNGTFKVCHGNARTAFSRLWDSIYAPKGYGFDANPWVLGCEFERRSK